MFNSIIIMVFLVTLLGLYRPVRTYIFLHSSLTTLGVTLYSNIFLWLFLTLFHLKNRKYLSFEPVLNLHLQSVVFLTFLYFLTLNQKPSVYFAFVVFSMILIQMVKQNTMRSDGGNYAIRAVKGICLHLYQLQI